MNGTRVPSGRSATASPPRTARFSFSATAHGALVVAHRPAVGPVEAPRSAPFALAELRPATPQLDGGLVVEGDPAAGVGRIDSRGQRLEQLAEAASALPQRLLDALLRVDAVRVREAGLVLAYCAVVRFNNSFEFGRDRLGRCPHGITRQEKSAREAFPLSGQSARSMRQCLSADFQPVAEEGRHRNARPRSKFPKRGSGGRDGNGSVRVGSVDKKREAYPAAYDNRAPSPLNVAAAQSAAAQGGELAEGTGPAYLSLGSAGVG